MPTRNVVLTEHHESLIAQLVQSGRYQNASEVMREGLRLIENREAEDNAKLEALRQAAQTGIAAIERGDYVEFSDAASLKAHLNSVADAALGGRHS
jgi:antitoxin ParD1/3/4